MLATTMYIKNINLQARKRNKFSFRLFHTERETDLILDFSSSAEIQSPDVYAKVQSLNYCLSYKTEKLLTQNHSESRLSSTKALSKC